MGIRSKTVAVFLSVTLFIAASPLLSAQTVYEPFRLTFPSYNTGTGFSAAWTLGGFNVSAADYRASDDSLSFSKGKKEDKKDGDDGKVGLETSAGSIIGDAFMEINGATRNLSSPLGADNTTMYVSFLLEPRGTLDQGLFNGFFGVTLNGSLGNDLFIGKPGGGSQDQYVLETRGGEGQVPSGVSTVVGKTVFLVVKAQFLPGNDQFTLYVNPKPGDSEPFNGVLKKDLDLGSVSKIGIYSTGAFVVDEIRIGSTFAEVTPPTERHDNH